MSDVEDVAAEYKELIDGCVRDLGVRAEAAQAIVARACRWLADNEAQALRAEYRRGVEEAAKVAQSAYRDAWEGSGKGAWAILGAIPDEIRALLDAKGGE